MKRQITLAPLAIQDIKDIHTFLLDREGAARAGNVLASLEDLIAKLDQHPQRGHSPPELNAMGFPDVLEIHFKPYRIIYRLRKQGVYVLVVADGRRNMGQLLARRLLH